MFIKIGNCYMNLAAITRVRLRASIDTFSAQVEIGGGADGRRIVLRDKDARTLREALECLSVNAEGEESLRS